MSTKGFTVAFTKRLIWPRSGSFETRSTDFEIGPEKVLVSTEVTTLPSAPGLMTLSNEATVHPHPGRASLMTRSDPPLFLTRKVVSMTWPFATIPASLVSGVTSIFGAVTTALALVASVAALGLAGAFCWACRNPATSRAVIATHANLRI